MVYIICFVISVMLQCNAQGECNDISYRVPIKVIPSATEKEFQPLQDFLMTLSVDEKDMYVEMQRAYDHASPDEIYYVDINNDGLKEYVLCTHEGSMGILTFTIIAPSQEKAEYHIVYLPDSPHLRLGTEIFYNIVDKREELFLEIKGKTYLCCANKLWGSCLIRDLYLWDVNNTLTWCHDDFWIAEQLHYFKVLCNKKLYYMAYPFLAGFEEKIRYHMDPVANLCMRKDVAYAAYYDGYPHRALTILNTLEGDTTYTHVDKNMLDEVAELKQKCLAALSSPCSHEYSYEWLLAYENKPERELMHAAKQLWESFLQAVVPDITEGSRCFREWSKPPLDTWHASQPLRMYIQEHISMIDSFAVTDSRYVTFCTMRPHDGVEHGFFWCDVKNRTSAVALYSEDSATLNIASNTLCADDIPDEFLQALIRWLKKYTADQRYALWYDKQGITRIKLF
jgi:hypothetical protein